MTTGANETKEADSEQRGRTNATDAERQRDPSMRRQTNSRRYALSKIGGLGEPPAADPHREWADRSESPFWGVQSRATGCLISATSFTDLRHPIFGPKRAGLRRRMSALIQLPKHPPELKTRPPIHMAGHSPGCWSRASGSLGRFLH
jgi:hypothetical protein